MPRKRATRIGEPVKLGTDIRTIWIASTPRCGSMWTFNVTRAIARAAGLRAVPETVPQSTQAMIAAGTEGLADPAPERVRVVKVHANMRPDMPYSRFILPRRDVRDAMISFMRFMRCGFEDGLDFVRNTLATDRHYDRVPPDRALIVDYANIVARPAAVLDGIAHFLQAPLAPEARDAIAASLDKQSVAESIRRTEQDLMRRSREGSPISADEVVVLGPQQLRAFDTATGFQSGHVSDYREGDWRQLLNAEQQSRLEALCARHAPAAA
jgi:hypothetical protein